MMITPTTQSSQENQRNTGRITFEGKTGTLSYKELTPHQNNNTFQLGCYPNFQIKDGQVLLDSPLPPDEIMPNPQTKLVIEKLLPESQGQEEGINKLQEYFEKQNLACVGQILVLYIQKYDPQHPDAQINWKVVQGTCFLLNFNELNTTYILSAFHLVNQEDKKNYDMIYLANFSEVDLAPKLENFVQVFLEESQNYTAYHQRCHYFHKQFPKSTEEFHNKIFPIHISYVYMSVRKRFLETTDSENYLLDPLFQNKPSPAVDLAIFNIDRKFIKEIKPLEIAPINYQDPGCILAMFAAPKHIKLDCQEKYAKTFEQDPRLLNAMHNLEMTQFVHENKSASYGEIILHSNLEQNPTIPFYSSTTFGACGAPLLDREGRVIAMNFGNYCDIESDQNDGEEDGIRENLFGRKIGNKERLDQCKNFNLAISLQHPVLSLFISERTRIIVEKSENKGRNKENRNEKGNQREIIQVEKTEEEEKEEMEKKRIKRHKQNVKKREKIKEKKRILREQKMEEEQNKPAKTEEEVRKEMERKRAKRHEQNVKKRQKIKEKKRLLQEQIKQQEEEKENLIVWRLDKLSIDEGEEGEETKNLIETQNQINQEIFAIIQQFQSNTPKKASNAMLIEDVLEVNLDQNQGYLKRKEENISQNRMKKAQERIEIEEEYIESTPQKKLKR